MAVRTIKVFECDYCGEESRYSPGTDDRPPGWRLHGANVTLCSDVSLFSTEEQSLLVCSDDCDRLMGEAVHEAKWAYSRRFDELVPAARARRDASTKASDEAEAEFLAEEPVVVERDVKPDEQPDLPF